MAHTRPRPPSFVPANRHYLLPPPVATPTMMTAPPPPHTSCDMVHCFQAVTGGPLPPAAATTLSRWEVVEHSYSVSSSQLGGCREVFRKGGTICRPFCLTASSEPVCTHLRLTATFHNLSDITKCYQKHNDSSTSV